MSKISKRVMLPSLEHKRAYRVPVSICSNLDTASYTVVVFVIFKFENHI